MTKPALVVLAAGVGSRYGGVKQIEPVGPSGERILDYSVYDALRAGFGRVVFVINEVIEGGFRAIAGDTLDRRCATAYVRQQVSDVPASAQISANRTKPWGTGQALLSCKNVVDGPLCVINADDFYGPTSFQILRDYLVAAQDRDGIHDWCMAGYRLESTLSEHGPVARGVCMVRDDGYLAEIEERTQIERIGHAARYTPDGGETWLELPLDTYVSMNMWGFTQGVFNELAALFRRFLQEAANLAEAEFFLPEVVNGLVQAGKAQVRVLPTYEQWVGMTYCADKPTVARRIGALVAQGVYPEKLWA